MREAASNSESARALIAVCVCTYARPAMLARLLKALLTQDTAGLFAFEVVVVDNDANRTAEPVVRAAAADSTILVKHDYEHERNISRARNRAVRLADGDLIAFIDDDEHPGADWLQRLYRTMTASAADVVFAPVLPEFPPEAPAWLHKARVFRRRRYPTGTRIGPDDARTGNVLMKGDLFAGDEPWFDPMFGRTGGEDSDFFLRHSRKGRVFIWCDEAVVHETVPPERWTAAFHLRRLWRSGTLCGEWIRAGRLTHRELFTNVLGLGAYGVALPASLFLPMHLRMRLAQKFAYCGGVVTAYCGWSLMRQRD